MTIEVSFNLSNANCIHDRFAIIDNELWHFGATVGGFHRDVNAVSRGWNADAHDAVQFLIQFGRWPTRKNSHEQRMAIAAHL